MTTNKEKETLAGYKEFSVGDYKVQAMIAYGQGWISIKDIYILLQEYYRSLPKDDLVNFILSHEELYNATKEVINSLEYIVDRAKCGREAYYTISEFYGFLLDELELEADDPLVCEIDGFRQIWK